MGLDSVELLMELKKAFNYEVPAPEAEKMSTFNDATVNFQQITSHYEIERVIIGITSEKCELSVEEIEPH